MKRDAIIDDLHKLRERIGRAHGFDVDRIAATIRHHEREAAGSLRRKGVGKTVGTLRRSLTKPHQN